MGPKPARPTSAATAKKSAGAKLGKTVPYIAIGAVLVVLLAVLFSKGRAPANGDNILQVASTLDQQTKTVEAINTLYPIVASYPDWR